jgi:hypothetical protein
MQMAEDVSAQRSTANGVTTALQTLLDAGFGNDFLSETPKLFEQASTATETVN